MHKLTYNEKSHSYWLDGKRCKSVTAVAKLAPDSFALDNWRKRQVAIGFTLEPRLREQVAVDLENKDVIDGVVDEAMRIAGAHHAANRGTQRHRASEIFDTGGKLITEQQEADARAWQRTLDAYGIEIVPDFIEGFAIHPEYTVSGRFDRIARYGGRHVILDLKSGANAVKYPQGTSVQLALYARAPFISKTISTAGDKSTVTEWTSPPEDLDLETGYIILLGDGMEIGELWEVDIGHGWLGAQLALNVVAWRKGKDYGRELSRMVQAPDLLGLISLCAAREDLEALYRDFQPLWAPEHTAAAKARISELESLKRLNQQQADGVERLRGRRSA